MRGIGRTDPSTPIVGRRWYSGAWRTEEEIEKRRAYIRAHRQRLGPRRIMARERGERMRDRTRAVEGRRWYAGRWRLPEEVEKLREYNRAKNRRLYKPRARKPRLTDEEREARATTRRHEVGERRRARQAARDVAKARAAEPKRAPSHVRAAWNKAAPGSIIRRKYPTLKALDTAALTGAFEERR